MPSKTSKSSVPSVPAPDAERAVDALLEQVRPLLVEAIARQVVSFDDIEADGAGIGDLIGRSVMAVKLANISLPPDLDDAVRAEALRRAGPDKPDGKPPKALTRNRNRKRKRTINTIRGPVEYARDYDYFPELRLGISPPRPAAGDPQ